MALINLMKSPYPYPGGKHKAAPFIWPCLGDPAHYIEPFCGTFANGLQRPHLANRPYFSETVNDLDGLLINAWRAIQLQPDATAEAASWPVSEVDQAARQWACVKWVKDRDVERMMVDPLWCDPIIAGYWLYGMGTWIGFGFADGKGAWVERDGRLVKMPKPGRGIGIDYKRPNIGNNGRGVHHAGTREPGIVSMYAPDWQFHPVTMPELRRWFGALSARLRHVRICCGDYKRVLTPSASITLSCDKKNPCGVFIDPPYADSAGRDMRLYSKDSGKVAHEAREWALKNGTNPLYRIVFAGYEGEHGGAFERAGWREIEWFTNGFLTGGYGNQGEDGHQQARERLWASPHCIQPAANTAMTMHMFDTDEDDYVEVE